MILDFSLVRDLENPRVIQGLPTELVRALLGLPEVEERAYAAVMFAYDAELPREYLRAHEQRETTVREAYFRAALAEFVALEEAAVRDFAQRNISRGPPRQFDSPSPLLHAFRLLRHLNIHLTRSGLAVMSRPAIMTFKGEKHEFEYEAWLVTGFDLAALLALRDSRRYSRCDLQQLAAWFNAAQAQWGALHMLVLAVRFYCEMLVAALPPSE